MITVCGSGSALLSQDLKMALSAEYSQWHFVVKHSICSNPSFMPHHSKALNRRNVSFFKCWISLDLGKSYRQIVTDTLETFCGSLE